MDKKDFDEFMESLMRWVELIAAPALVGLVGLIMIALLNLS